MVGIALRQLNDVRIVGNSGDFKPNPVGIVGTLLGYTESGNPIVDYFSPLDGTLHTQEFDPKDVEIVER